MKNNIVLIVILAIVWPTLLGNSVAQTVTEMPQETDTIEGWKASDMEYLREHQGDFVQKRMDFYLKCYGEKGWE